MDIGEAIGNVTKGVTKRDVGMITIGVVGEAIFHPGEKIIKTGLGWLNKGMDKIDDYRKNKADDKK